MKHLYILEELLNKYYSRCSKDGEMQIKSVSLTPKNFREEYQAQRDFLDEMEEYEQDSFIFLKYFENTKFYIKKISLNIEKIEEIEFFVKKHNKKFKTLNDKLADLHNTFSKCDNLSGAAKSFYDFVIFSANSHLKTINEDKKVLDCISFIENNKEIVYVREMSQTIFGDTKVLDDGKILAKAIKYIRGYYNFPDTISDIKILNHFYIVKPDESIRLKGEIKIRTKSGNIIDISDFSGGLDFPQSSLKDIDFIRIVGDGSFVTIENKTTYERMSENAQMYLGGFATKEQIKILKKIRENNADADCYHFGDIDAGGLRIFKNLRDETGIDFRTKYMSGYIGDARYKDYVKPLTANDKKSLNSLLQYRETKGIAREILAADTKLEQEIISRYLGSAT